MGTSTIRGPEARIVWGYHTAASLGPWTFTEDGSVRSVTAKVVTCDECAVAQQPLTFVVPRPRGHKWAWPVEMLQIVDGQLQASVGPLQE